jgi:hypothetical protein
MTKLFSLFAALVSLFAVSPAQAGVPGTCGMEFEMTVTDPFLIPRYTGEGTGEITCTDLNGKETTSPIVISVVGWGPGVGEYTLNGVSGDINVASARELEGDFGGAAIQFFAANVQMGFTGKKTGLKFGVNLALNESGLGLFAGATTWSIRLAR